jgi:hypothetical protein
VPAEQLAVFTAMQARLAKIEEDNAAREAANREEQIKILAAKGQIEEALKQQRESAAAALREEQARRLQVEERAKRYALDGELARSLAAQPLVPGGAEQLTALLRDKFTVEAAGAGYAVRSEDFRDVGSYVGAILGRPEFSHFLRAQNPGGGTGAVGAQSVQTAAASSAPPAEPKNFSDAVFMQFAATQKTTADPRLNPTVPFGLRPTGPATKTG